uniref:Ras-GAP domain-containing protein n=2 Tax=Entamoeba invadens TaxID=33085 RepID=S0B7L0_ENTIV|nr:hypothetical protein [Entamoeba invadens]
MQRSTPTPKTRRPNSPYPRRSASSESGEKEFKDIYESALELHKGFPEGLFTYLTRNTLDDKTKGENCTAILAYYDQEYKAGQFIVYCIKRELFLRLDTSEKNPYPFILSSLLNSMLGPIVEDIIKLTTKYTKTLKGTDLSLKDRDPKSSACEKKSKQIKEYLQAFFEIITDLNRFPVCVRYYYATLSKELKTMQPINWMKGMVQAALYAPFDLIFKTLMKVMTQNYELNILLVFSDAFRALSNSVMGVEIRDEFWKHFLNEYSSDLITLLKDKIGQYDLFLCEEEEVSFNLSNYNGVRLNTLLEKEWKNMKEYIPESAYNYFVINTDKTPENYLIGKIVQLMTDIHSINVKSQIEKQSFLLIMAEMKVKIKDLNEEKRYLRHQVRDRLGIDFEDDETEEEKTVS